MGDGVPVLWTVRDVAERFGVSVWTVRRWIETGRLPAMRGVGRQGHRIREADVLAFLESWETAREVDQVVKEVKRQP